MNTTSRPVAWQIAQHNPLRGILARRKSARVPIATKLILSYLLVVVIAVATVGLLGTRIIDDLILSEAQATVRNDLNAAREILKARLSHVEYVVRLTADRYFVREAVSRGDGALVANDLIGVRLREGLDFLTLTDATGRVLVRTSSPSKTGDRHQTGMLAVVMLLRRPASSVALMSAEELRMESPSLADLATIPFVSTPRARPRTDTLATAGMVLEAAAPVLDGADRMLGVLYGGILLNRNAEIVDKVKQTVFQDVRYRGQEIGTATIFLDDVRIATNVRNPDGSRAIGTRAAEPVYNQVVLKGEPWIGRAYVVNNWYITAYEPIRDLTHRILGMLYVGVLEQKYVDLRRRAVAWFLAIILTGAVASAGLSYLISRRASSSIRRLVSASGEIARGNLDTRVDINTNDELQDLSETFNSMAGALKERDEQLREHARKRIMESERLATIGQLAAGVAHELNNPLQGIVTYAHLLLERATPDNPARGSLQKIANQADRCREIIRGLLDYSRPRPPALRLSNVNSLVHECLSLVENQALFHNIEIVREFAPDLPSATLDPSQMQQVFMNLIMNAAEAMDGVGCLTMRTSVDRKDGAIVVECADTGHGIRPEDLGRIFDPFFTTKGLGRGTGLGLSISHTIIREHGGAITVTSEVGKGTAFTVRLPAGPGGST